MVYCFIICITYSQDNIVTHIQYLYQLKQRQVWCKLKCYMLHALESVSLSYSFINKRTHIRVQASHSLKFKLNHLSSVYIQAYIHRQVCI